MILSVSKLDYRYDFVPQAVYLELGLGPLILFRDPNYLHFWFQSVIQSGLLKEGLCSVQDESAGSFSS